MNLRFNFLRNMHLVFSAKLQPIFQQIIILSHISNMWYFIHVNEFMIHVYDFLFFVLSYQHHYFEYDSNCIRSYYFIQIKNIFDCKYKYVIFCNCSWYLLNKHDLFCWLQHKHSFRIFWLRLFHQNVHRKSRSNILILLTRNRLHLNSAINFI